MPFFDFSDVFAGMCLHVADKGLRRHRGKDNSEETGGRQRENVGLRRMETGVYCFGRPDSGPGSLPNTWRILISAKGMPLGTAQTVGAP